MADSEIETVLKELLGRQDLSADTRAELEDFQAQAQAGGLDATDRAYVVAFAKRVGARSAARAGAAAPANDTAVGYDDDEEPSWPERALAAEAKLQAIQDSFERMFGPQAEPLANVDSMTRQHVYDHFKRELERIERGEG